MSQTGKLDVKDHDLLKTLRQFFKDILNTENINAILAPWRLPMKNMVMPTLITQPEHIDAVDPLSPAFPMNGAKVVSRLTRKASGGKVAAVLRPCEIRAFVELVKLKQGRTEDLIIIGIDCLGALTNRDYFKWAEEDTEQATQSFYKAILSGREKGPEGAELAPACQVCEMPLPSGADLAIGLFGLDTASQIQVRAQTAEGEKLFDSLGLSAMEEPSSRLKTVNQLIEDRIAARDRMIAETRTETEDLEKLTRYLANCVNCYNCRVACPVCYCRECVFVTDVFDHDPSQYLLWATRKGAVKMPTDTIFYHITRMAHMSTACVGCGQCSNACPNDIPVMELFRTVARQTQQAFDYEAGRSFEEVPPLSVFKADEFAEVVGI